MSDYNDNDGAEYQLGVDLNRPDTPVYFSFESKNGMLEFWFSPEEAKDMADMLREILNDIELKVKYDSHH